MTPFRTTRSLLLAVTALTALAGPALPESLVNGGGGNIPGVTSLPKAAKPEACFGRLAEARSMVDGGMDGGPTPTMDAEVPDAGPGGTSGLNGTVAGGALCSTRGAGPTGPMHPAWFAMLLVGWIARRRRHGR